MAEEVNDAVAAEDEELLQEETLGARFMDWVRTELVWYAGSFTVHLLGLSLLLLMGNFVSNTMVGDAPVFEEAKVDKDTKIPDKPFDIGTPPDTPPPDLNVDPTIEKPAQAAQEEEKNDDSAQFLHKGGGLLTGKKDITSIGAATYGFGGGPKPTGALGIGMGLGTGTKAGSGGDGSGFGFRGSGSRKAMLATQGGTKRTERSVTAALIWLAKHQLSDGSWSLQNYVQRCTDKTCTGTGDVTADSGATAMGLLPFLAAGQTHKVNGAYRATVAEGLHWLMKNQQPDGNLAKGAQQMMYSHGLATIALCEAYGLTSDKQVGNAAQGAVNFIINAQNKNDGGWRYNPGDAGDTSVVGWQIMALKSAHMAGLSVGGSTFANTSKWLDSVSHNDGSQYGYQPSIGPVNTMTSVGLLCRQYLGAKRDSAMMSEGTKYLMGNMPDAGAQNIYYWYYATQVLHNMSGSDWDAWNRNMRKILVDTQNKNIDECANGSWDPARDQWGRRGGRVMMTSLSALTLEIYYRYLPLFKAAEGQAAEAGPAKEVGKADSAPAKKI